MDEQHDEPSAPVPAPTRRKLLTILPAAACSALAVAAAGCAQQSAEPWKPPDWMRSKRGSRGNGASSR